MKLSILSFVAVIAGLMSFTTVSHAAPVDVAAVQGLDATADKVTEAAQVARAGDDCYGIKHCNKMHIYN
ncbi:hypothetical protein HDV05_005911 [Chytridiales sp. JEL 0842]|nr:hypothetical protein HDV05_005911 [Chytridiales sp. JEL 0842]